ncbi:MAG: chitobiase/beta-hexosaminidase C-terminal domain-containing protein [Terriglobia bacterium]
MLNNHVSAGWFGHVGFDKLCAGGSSQIAFITRAGFVPRSRGRQVLKIALLCFCLILAVATPARSQGSVGTFTVFDAPGAATTVLAGTAGITINAAGDVTGIYFDANHVAHGFVRTAAGAMTTFDAPDAGTGLTQGTVPISINAADVVTGEYFDINNAYHGFVRTADGTLTEFDVPGIGTTGHRGTSPTSINAAGDITGFYRAADGVYHGFLRAADGTITTFNVPAAGTGFKQGTMPLSINSNGDIAGMYADTSGVGHGFVLAADGTFTAPIDVPGAGSGGSTGDKDIPVVGTLPTSINTAGDISGVYADTSGIRHAFVRSADGTFTAPIDAPGAATGSGVLMGTFSFSINTNGDIVGGYTDANSVTHGVRRTAEGTLTAPIDAPGAGTAGTSLYPGTVCVGINDSGVMTGGYFDASGVLHGFVLTSAPPAATPTFSVPAGTYTSAQTVTISDTTTGATIYYTTNGTTPTTSSTPYTSLIKVSSTETIEAIARASGYGNSAVATATYTITTSPPLASVSTTTLSFAALMVKSTSSPQPVTLSNTGDSVLTVASIASSGNFAQTNTCGSSVAAGASCTVSVTFTPQAGGSLTGTLTITDNSNNTTGSTQTVSLSGTGQDYTFDPSSSSPTSATVAPSSTASYSLSLGGQGGLSGTVSFSCAGAPSGATCTVSPNPATVGSSPTTVTVQVTTTAASISSPRTWPNPPARPLSPGMRRLLMLALLLAAMAWAAVRRNQLGASRWRSTMFTLAAGLLLTLAFAGCGGGSSNSSTNAGTPAGTYTLTVTGTAGSGSSALSHSVTLTLIVS